MSREEAIIYLKRADVTVGQETKTKTAEALEMAIEALEQERNIGDEAYAKGWENGEIAERSRYKQEPCDDAISRQAVLDIIMPYCTDDDGSIENTDDLRNALDDIESLPPVQPIRPKGEWISVSERLPLLRGLCKISNDVLITNGFETDMGYLVERKGKIFWHYYGGDYEVGIKDEDNDAIAWMPIPEPYKEKKSV